MKKYSSKKSLLPALLLALILPIALIATGCGGSTPNLNRDQFEGRWAVYSESFVGIPAPTAGGIVTFSIDGDYRTFTSTENNTFGYGTWTTNRNRLVATRAGGNNQYQVAFSNYNNTLTLSMGELYQIVLHRVAELNLNSLSFREIRTSIHDVNADVYDYTSYFRLGAEQGPVDVAGHFGVQTNTPVVNGNTITITTSEHANFVVVNFGNMFGTIDTNNLSVRIDNATAGVAGFDIAPNLYTSYYAQRDQHDLAGWGQNINAYQTFAFTGSGVTTDASGTTRTINFFVEHNGVPHTFTLVMIRPAA
ncbi:MAG: hypothetical protein FWE01_02910 [Firmicutes bacterium]|nr:hypothetical protein [Bacillota bacterium]